MKMYRENGFPVTIVRPDHTYDENNIPLGVHEKTVFGRLSSVCGKTSPSLFKGTVLPFGH